jgi:hypothetical protein
VPLGTASAPTVTFTGDLNTGIYSPGADQFGISTGGTSRLVVEADGDINIDSGGVFYDATNNRLAIGTTSPSTLLHVNTGSDATAITVAASVATGGQLLIGTGAKVAGQQSIVSSGNGLDIGTLSGVPITFFTDGTANERARIDANGRLLVGTSSALTGNNTVYARLQVVGNSAASPAGGLIAIGRNEAATSITAGETLGTLVWGDSGAGEYAWITCEADANAGSGDYPGRLSFSTTADGASSPTERYRITQDGRSVYYNTGYVYPDSDNTVQLGGPSNRFTAVYAVNGTIQTSDERAKTQVTDSSLGIDFIKALRPVSYKWIEGGLRHTGEYDEDNNWVYESVPGLRTHWGFIAQEVKEAVDAAGVDFGGWVLTDKDNPDSQQALRYDQFIAPLTKALQEALQKIEDLEQRLTDAGIA